MLTNQLKELMTRRGVTEMSLAERAGVTQVTVNVLRNTRRVPRLDTALRIARALKVPVEKIWSLSARNAA